jgi:hypothetical protein
MPTLLDIQSASPTDALTTCGPDRGDTRPRAKYWLYRLSSARAYELVDTAHPLTVPRHHLRVCTRRTTPARCSSRWVSSPNWYVHGNEPRREIGRKRPR